jgi:hypothetical protein
MVTEAGTEELDGWSDLGGRTPGARVPGDTLLLPALLSEVARPGREIAGVDLWALGGSGDTRWHLPSRVADAPMTTKASSTSTGGQSFHKRYP